LLVFLRVRPLNVHLCRQNRRSLRRNADGAVSGADPANNPFAADDFNVGMTALEIVDVSGAATGRAALIGGRPR
jgi:hypothetical protein